MTAGPGREAEEPAMDGEAGALRRMTEELHARRDKARLGGGE
jgi:hypothetical protein